ncbi:hypothetical protein RU03_03535 [Pseudomonas simiae]|nr:hypothetical protein RU03_03535 [Pseudomonas simiae]
MAAGELDTSIIAFSPRLLQAYLWVNAKSRAFFLAQKAILQPPVTASVGLHFQVQTLFVIQAVRLVLGLGVAAVGIFQGHWGHILSERADERFMPPYMPPSTVGCPGIRWENAGKKKAVKL